MRKTVIVLVLALVAAACGGDAETTATTEATTTTVAPTTTAAPTTTTTAAPTTTAAAETTWFDPLEVGLCFDDAWAGDDFDFSVPPAIVPCDGPHDNEVVGLVDLPTGDYPGGETLTDNVEVACSIAYDAFFGGATRAQDYMFIWNVVPDEADWAAGARIAACVTYAGEPVRGTARSADLTAPGTLLGVIHEVDGQADVWIIRGEDGELAINVSNSPASIQLSPPGWTSNGAVILWAEGDSEPSRRIAAARPPEEPINLLGALDVDSVGSPAVNPTDDRLIAVIAAPDGGEFDVFLYDGDADTLTNLTADNADRDTTPNWSPDGTKLLYRSRIDGNSDVWVMDADGSNKTRLTTDPGFDGDPRWSPDGTQILFTTDRTGDFEIFVMNADGSDQRNLTNHPGDDEYPSWSPDGAIIAFHSDRHGGISLWLMNADGSDQTNISWLGPVGYPSFWPGDADEG